MIVSINLLVILKLAPFVDDADDYLSFLTSCQMFLTLQGGLLIMTDDSTKPTYDPNFMGDALCVINGVGFLALVASLMMLHPKCRKKMNGKQALQRKRKRKRKRGGESGSSRNSSKVVPAENGIRNWKIDEEDE
jgi:hypothetical protein